MRTLSLEFTEYFKIRLSSNDPAIVRSFSDYLSTTQYSSFMVRPKNGKPFMKTTESQIKLFSKSGNDLLIDAGLADYLAVYVGQLYSLYNKEIDLKINLPKPEHIPLPDKWQKIFASHPRGESFAQNQLTDFPKIVSKFCGTVELFTGYGKTELMLAVAESLNTRTMILAPDNAILSEIRLRAEKYEVDVGVGDWSKQINVINPIGFMRSNKLNDEARAYFDEVKACLVDEAHHTSAASYTNFYGMLRQLERSYGFSASVDTSGGTILMPGQTTVKDLGPKNAKITGLVGTIRARRRLPIPVHILNVKCRVADHAACRENNSGWMEAFDHTTGDPALARIINNVIYTEGPRNYFIPIYKKESGFALYKNLRALGTPTTFWVAGELWVDDERITGVDTVEYMKKHMKDSPSRAVISTRFEGIDLPNLDGIIPLVGSSYRMIIQPVGRSARKDDVLVVLIDDMNSPIVRSQYRTRREWVEKEYSIVTNRTRSM